jgi:MerR family transcriptional regulator, copper efflux regulator
MDPDPKEPGMPDPKPVACSLGASELQTRLRETATVGAASLIAHDEDAGRHTLRFRADSKTRHKLEEIVAAEGECCPFLDLDLTERDGELVLTLVAPAEGQSIADELAVAFSGTWS